MLGVPARRVCEARPRRCPPSRAPAVLKTDSKTARMPSTTTSGSRRPTSSGLKPTGVWSLASKMTTSFIRCFGTGPSTSSISCFLGSRTGPLGQPRCLHGSGGARSGLAGAARAVATAWNIWSPARCRLPPVAGCGARGEHPRAGMDRRCSTQGLRMSGGSPGRSASPSGQPRSPPARVAPRCSGQRQGKSAVVDALAGSRTRSMRTPGAWAVERALSSPSMKRGAAITVRAGGAEPDGGGEAGLPQLRSCMRCSSLGAGLADYCRQGVAACLVSGAGTLAGNWSWRPASAKHDLDDDLSRRDSVVSASRRQQRLSSWSLVCPT